MENELGDLLGQLADAVVAASEGDYRWGGQEAGRGVCVCVCVCV